MREGIGEGEEGRDEGMSSDGRMERDGEGGMGGRKRGGRKGDKCFIFTAIILEAVIRDGKCCQTRQRLSAVTTKPMENVGLRIKPARG